MRSLDEIRPDGYFPDLAPETIFINPSPMTADPLFVARLAGNPGIRRVAVVHDFIPLDDRPRYLPGRGDGIAYTLSLTWLRRYDLFLPVSEPTRRRLETLFGAARCVVTGAALPAWAAPGPPEVLLHILVVAGDDPRKNPEVVIKAHAGSQALQAAQIKLVVIGGYAPEAMAALRGLAQSEGGDPDLLHLPGRVSEAELEALYRGAICAVTPSSAEGFSLPVLEAMAVGTASLASDIPAHAALVRDPRLRFPPDDAAALRALLERAAADPGFRAGIIAGQAGTWPEFSAEKVAARLWSAILEMPPGRGHIGARPRIALIAPFPPARSAAADFAAACAAALAGHAELALFSPRPGRAGGLPVAPLSALPYLSRHIDRVITVLDSAAPDPETEALLLRHGGAVIWHGGTEDPARLAEAARHARPLILHAAGMPPEALSRADARDLPFPIIRPLAPAIEPARGQAKARLGFDPAITHIISLGTATAGETAAALAALALLLQGNAAVRLHMTAEPDPAALALTTEPGLESHIRVTGHVPEPVYRDYLLAADIALKLSEAPAVRISGTLQDYLVACLPIVTTAKLAAALEAPEDITRISDILDPAEIAEALRHPRTPIAPRRAAYREARGMARYAAALCDMLGLSLG